MTTTLPPLTTADVLRRVPPVRGIPRLPAPEYVPQPASDPPSSRIFLAVESFRRHMTDEGWQIQSGLQDAGYSLFGHGFDAPFNVTRVPSIIKQFRPSTAIIQDPREWDASTANCFVKDAQFRGASVLGRRPSIFKLAVLKDAHRDGDYYREKAEQMGVHGWIVYYHPAIVAHLAPWARQQHFVRTYHTVDVDAVPPFSTEGRAGTVISGACGSAIYPLRTRLVNAARSGKLKSTSVVRHPGYGARGTHTPAFLRLLSHFKVSICTASVFGFSLRKIVESTACGCRVLTDLPVDEVMPEIDGNLTRINPSEPGTVIAETIRRLEGEYDAEQQREWAEKAKARFDWRVEARRLAGEIENLRNQWSSHQWSNVQ